MPVLAACRPRWTTLAIGRQSEPVPVGLPGLDRVKGEPCGVVLDKKLAEFISTTPAGTYWPALPPADAVTGPVTVMRISEP